MSSSSSPSQLNPSPASTGPQRDAIIAALQRRQGESTTSETEIQHEQEHEIRQAFRRMIDPGIMRGTHKDTAFASMKVLLKLAENLISDPHNIKYQRFKPTNTAIKTNLLDVKGALEYAVTMGFRADAAAIKQRGSLQVQDFQPYYVFNPSCMRELRIGAAVLKDSLTRETEKEERAQRFKKEENSIKQMQSQKIKLAFQDDRKRRALQDKLEKERREARLANPAPPISTSPDPPMSELIMPTSPGRRLVDPPPYDSESEPDTD